MGGPTIDPTSQYDLTADPVHALTLRGEVAVKYPSLSHRFALATDAPPHTLPHNAEKLGFKRYIPSKKDDLVPQSAGLSIYSKEGTENVYPPFLYTQVPMTKRNESDDNVSTQIVMMASSVRIVKRGGSPASRWNGTGPIPSRGRSSRPPAGGVS
ncbi:hypothetical protein P7C73_g5564, partial [Tremellales sp. Uapishka_1]